MSDEVGVLMISWVAEYVRKLYSASQCSSCFSFADPSLYILELDKSKLSTLVQNVLYIRPIELCMRLSMFI